MWSDSKDSIVGEESSLLFSSNSTKRTGSKSRGPRVDASIDLCEVAEPA